jgi:Protein of unknown function (DUF3489)
MMKRAKGATLAEIVKATGWQPHTVRGFVSIWARTPIRGWQNRTECFARYGVIWRREFQKPYGSGPTSFQEHLPNGHMLKTLGHGFEAVPSQVRIAPTIWRSPSGVRSSFMI